MNIGFAMCGSFCTYQKVFPILEILSRDYQVTPIFTDASYGTDSRFGSCGEHIEAAMEICGTPPLHTIAQAEPIGPKKLLDVLVIAPCTVNCLAKLAWGLADDALSTYAVTHNQQVLLAPAMNPKMWQNPAVKQNVELLKSRNVELLGPAAGRVACGTEGLGRMVEPEQIFERICQILPPEVSPRIPTHSRD